MGSNRITLNELSHPENRIKDKIAKTKQVSEPL
jgi:hypothetical protein